jgi:cytochrome c
MRAKGYSARRKSFLGARTATVTVLSLFLVIGLGRAADIKQGEELFKEHCAACHTVIESVRDKSGPNLNGVVGRNAGTENYGHGYTEEMMASGVTWGIATLQAFLNSPALMVRGTKMVFRGLPDANARLDIACYLEQIADRNNATPNALCAMER